MPDRTDPSAALAAKRGRADEVETHLALALEAGALGTWRWDARTGQVEWDEQLERIFGLEPGRFDGTFDTWVSLIHPDDRDRVLAQLDEAVQNESSYRVEHRIVWPDGSVRWLQGRGNVTLDAEGRVSGTIGCTGDITASKRVEQQAEERARAAAAWAAREQRARERLQFLVGLTEAALAADSHSAFMDRATSLAVPRLGDWCSLHFVPPGSTTIERRVAHADPQRVEWANALADRHPHNPHGTHGVPAVMRTGRTEFIADVDDALIDTLIRESSIPRDQARAIVDALALTSIITVPLRSRRGVIGALQVVSAESGIRFENEDVALAEAAAGRIAEALEQLWLADQHRSISATLQRALLPPELPRIPDVDHAARYWPAGAAAEVGGDFYDVFALDEGEWALLIGDVCGTGADAAAVSGIVRHTVRAAARHGHAHDEVLEWINDAVRQSGRDRFCTACYATLRHEDNGSFRFASASAGHPLPVIVRAGTAAAMHGRAGTLLGVFEEISTHTVETVMQPGDTLVLYTDGVTDLPPPFGFTPDETVELMRRAASSAGTAEAVVEALRAALDERLPMDRRHDDIAMVALRIARRRHP